MSNILHVHVATPPDEWQKVTNILADATRTVAVQMPPEGVPPPPFAEIRATAVAENALIAAQLVQQLLDQGCILRHWAYGFEP